MVIVSTDHVPGRGIARTVGECFGLVVCARNLGVDYGADFRAIIGGEVKAVTHMLTSARQEAIARLSSNARRRGADAVVGFRFETTEYQGVGVEVCAYGTAVVLERE